MDTNNKNKRVHRVESLIMRNLASIITREVFDPRLDHLSITAVHVSRDLSFAKIFYSIGLEGDAEILSNCAQALNKASSYIRKMLAQRVSLRIVPQLDFVYDDSQARGARIDSLIRDSL